MSYNEFIKKLAENCRENGIGMNQERLKQIIDLMAELIADEIEEKEVVKLRNFLLFDIVTVPPKHLPNGTVSEEQLSIRVRLSNNYKRKIKDKLNDKK